MERELSVPLVLSQWVLQLQKSARFFVPGAPYTLLVSTCANPPHAKGECLGQVLALLCETMCMLWSHLCMCVQGSAAVCMLVQSLVHA